MTRDTKKFGRRYPWTIWFTQGRFTVTRGKDFECFTHGMAQMIRNVARRRRVKVSLRVTEDEIDVIVLKSNGVLAKS